MNIGGGAGEGFNTEDREELAGESNSRNEI